MNEENPKLPESKKSFKVGFYTFIIFSIILLIWFYTNPIFNKKRDLKQTTQINPDVVDSVGSIGESFKTTWLNVSENIKRFKK